MPLFHSLLLGGNFVRRSVVGGAGRDLVRAVGGKAWTPRHHQSVESTRPPPLHVKQSSPAVSSQLSPINVPPTSTSGPLLLHQSLHSPFHPHPLIPLNDPPFASPLPPSLFHSIYLSCCFRLHRLPPPTHAPFRQPMLRCSNSDLLVLYRQSMCTAGKWSCISIECFIDTPIYSSPFAFTTSFFLVV